MANKYPNYVGEVDVISDSENIKKLLKIPFSKSHISIMVHKVGKTLLLDDFDISKLILNEEKQQWRWLKRFLEEMCKVDEKIILRKNKSRSNLQSKLMLSKFLYHSLDSTQVDHALEGDSINSDETPSISMPENLSLSPSKKSREDSWTLDLSFDSVVSELDMKVDNTYSTSNDSEHKPFLRDYVWTFEDIQMLLGSDMPIFGDSNHPAISLRLRDMKKPINVLTGIDYWLDNLMCSVPEVMMCYHLDGIVQKYERLKTEDIPHMKNCQFSPMVVRDIAQNLLTFLKSKITKSGHTYWLLKSKEGDVVKLYDLTTLCENYFDEDSSNPYVLPVAMLFYRVAKHLIDSGSKKIKRIHDLLNNCLRLVDPKKHKQISISVKYLLSELLIPNNIDPTVPVIDSNENDSDNDEYCNDRFDESQSSTEDSGDETYATLQIAELIVPSNSRKRKIFKKSSSDFLGSDWEKRGLQAIGHLIDALNDLINIENLQSNKNSRENEDELPRMAKPFEPIPMEHGSLNSGGCSVLAKVEDCDNMSKNFSAPAKLAPNWQNNQIVLLLRKLAQIFCFLSESASNGKKYRKALNFIKLGLLCDQTAKALKIDVRNNNYGEILPCLLGSCGDCHFFLLKGDEIDQSEENFPLHFEENLKIICDKIDLSAKDKYCWCFNTLINVDHKVEERLSLSVCCYEEALTVIKNESEAQYSALGQELTTKLKKKYGNGCNELACLYMNKATHIFEQTEVKDEALRVSLQNLTKKSIYYLERGVEAFSSINDTLNLVFIYSNTAKLMRVCAHIFVPLNSENKRSEFSQIEKQFYAKAIGYYESAMKNLESTADALKESNSYEEVWDQLNWDLCTTLFTLGSLMQDYAPLSYCAFEDIERDISNSFNRALQLCSEAEKRNSFKLCLYQYRAGTLHHKLASLYHHSFRNMSDSDSKRRQVFQLADDHFEKAMSRFEKLENKNEFLQTILERVGMHEHLLSSLTGFGSKIRQLQTILQFLIRAESTSKMKMESDEEDAEETSKLMKFVLQRIQLCIKGLLRVYSSKMSKYKQNHERWKALDDELSSLLEKLMKKKKLKSSLELYIWQVCEKCSSTLEIELRFK
ncbi:erythroid differentiation-related factor 1-like protein [Dinothrombium tinctorium]|uniref:Erythroid differentiation-related factor 1-like protein n=1 Tax=Dinothrombium tinctorium TaxID=1965070 RepID=A0A3S3PQ49_9ACAR|nr:erythroid differentiation-related factor 1-like protein [Dinothrombium tinctorium]